MTLSHVVSLAMPGNTISGHDTSAPLQTVDCQVSTPLISWLVSERLAVWRLSTGHRSTICGSVQDPYYRKEMLCLWRDKAAILQMILIPLSLVALQALNLQHLTKKALEHWNTLCSLAVLCGTYFLIVVGPRSLTSEGACPLDRRPGPGVWNHC